MNASPPGASSFRHFSQLPFMASVNRVFLFFALLLAQFRRCGYTDVFLRTQILSLEAPPIAEWRAARLIDNEDPRISGQSDPRALRSAHAAWRSGIYEGRSARRRRAPGHPCSRGEGANPRRRTRESWWSKAGALG